MATEARWSTQRRSVVIEPEWLAGHLDDPAVRIIEVDEDTAAYGRGHIPNAVAWDWFADLHHPVRRDYADQETLAGLLRRSGVDHATTVVLYGGADNWFAAYAYWLLRHRGFDQVQLLSGGRRAWELEGRPLTREVPNPAPTTVGIDGRELWHLRAFRDDVLIRLGEARFVDVRSREEFEGLTLGPPQLVREHAVLPGHIPGAVNIPWSEAVNGDGRFKSTEELRQLYEGRGVTPDQAVVTYCRIGERSAHSWFVLHELLGYPSVANYDGSWAEYGSLVGVPVEVGGPPGEK